MLADSDTFNNDCLIDKRVLARVYGSCGIESGSLSTPQVTSLSVTGKHSDPAGKVQGMLTEKGSPSRSPKCKRISSPVMRLPKLELHTAYEAKLTFDPYHQI